MLYEGVSMIWNGSTWSAQRTGSMAWEESIRGRVFSTLESWGGYDVVRDLMRRYSEVDIYVAGGVIRDTVLAGNTHLKDVDLFLIGTAVDQVICDLDRHGTVRTGPFGSPRWMPHGTNQYADVIPITRFFNGLWVCQDIVDVLNQFDFTCNAVALDLRTGAFFDPQNGVRDGRQRVMRAVRFDYPEQPIAPDNKLSRPAVLWFRLLHYAASRRLSIEPVTLRWLRENRRYQLHLEPFVSSFFSLHPKALVPLEQDVSG
jgi:hypothetical protein